MGRQIMYFKVPLEWEEQSKQKNVTNPEGAIHQMSEYTFAPSEQLPKLKKWGKWLCRKK